MRKIKPITKNADEMTLEEQEQYIKENNLSPGFLTGFLSASLALLTL